jgi:hypothetical protein
MRFITTSGVQGLRPLDRIKEDEVSEEKELPLLVYHPVAVSTYNEKVDDIIESLSADKIMSIKASIDDAKAAEEQQVLELGSAEQLAEEQEALGPQPQGITINLGNMGQPLGPTQPFGQAVAQPLGQALPLGQAIPLGQAVAQPLEQSGTPLITPDGYPTAAAAMSTAPIQTGPLPGAININLQGLQQPQMQQPLQPMMQQPIQQPMQQQPLQPIQQIQQPLPQAGGARAPIIAIDTSEHAMTLDGITPQVGGQRRRYSGGFQPQPAATFGSFAAPSQSNGTSLGGNITITKLE